MLQNLTSKLKLRFFVTLLAVATPTFFAVVATTFFLLPEKYASFTRLESINPVETNTTFMSDPFWLQTQFEIIKSQSLLKQVVKDLSLDAVFSKQLNVEHTLTLDETCQLLLRHVKVQQTRGASAIEIWVYDSDRVLAAMIANDIAKKYAQEVESKHGSVKIYDIAMPGLRPVSPNIPLNLCLGLAGSLGLGAVVGMFLTMAIALRNKKQTQGKPSAAT